MNEIEFERTDRYVTASVRVDAARIAHSHDALATLLANEVPVVGEPTPTTVPIDPVRALHQRASWLPILVAASTIAAAAGVAFLTNRGRESTVVSTEPDLDRVPHFLPRTTIARGLTSMHRATWDAASTLDTSTLNGCLGMFC